MFSKFGWVFALDLSQEKLPGWSVVDPCSGLEWWSWLGLYLQNSFRTGPCFFVKLVKTCFGHLLVDLALVFISGFQFLVWGFGWGFFQILTDFIKSLLSSQIFYLFSPLQKIQLFDLVDSGVLDSHIHFCNQQLALLVSRKPLCYTHTLVLLNNFPLFFPWDHVKLVQQSASEVCTRRAPSHRKMTEMGTFWVWHPNRNS